MRKIGIFGGTRLGYLVIDQSPNFYYVERFSDADFDVFVFCDSGKSLSVWGAEYNRIVENIKKFRLSRNENERVVLLASTSNTEQNKIILLVLNEISKAYGWKIIKVPKMDTFEDYQYIAKQVSGLIDKYETLPRISTCKLPNFLIKLFGG